MSGTSSPFPVPTAPVVNSAGQLTHAWWYFLQTLFTRTGGAAGINVATLQTEITAVTVTANTALTTANAASAAANAAQAAANAAQATANAAQAAATSAATSAAAAQATANDAEVMASMIVEP